MCGARHAWVRMQVQVQVDGHACRWACMWMDVHGNAMGAGHGMRVLGPGCGHSDGQDRCHMSGWACMQ